MDSDLHDLSNKEKAELNTVEIGDYVLVGAYCVVLPGVKIGSHCVIGSGSIVSRDIPDHSVAVGAPARVIRKIDDRDLAL
jgi:maltose O-acetyltransferase